jgi:hypothetical protein
MVAIQAWEAPSIHRGDADKAGNRDAQRTAASAESSEKFPQTKPQTKRKP